MQAKSQALSAVHTLTRAAITVQSMYCYDEPDGQILLHRITEAAEDIAWLCGCNESVMDGYRRFVFSSRPNGIVPLTAQEAREAQRELTDFVQNSLPGALDDVREKLTESIAAWDGLFEAAGSDGPDDGMANHIQ